MKRFWKTATPIPAEAGYTIALDGRPLRLPGGLSLTLATAPLAEAVAAEWQKAGGGQGGEFAIESLPLTRLAATQQEHVAPARKTVVDALATYADSDLVCYRAEFPPELAARQAASWDRLLTHVHERTAVRLAVTAGVMPVAQPKDACTRLKAALQGRADADLAALAAIVPATSSLVIGLCLADGAITGTEAVSHAFLDEDFQRETWGFDAEAAERRARIAQDIETATEFLKLSRIH